jgi:hypothetical protein
MAAGMTQEAAEAHADSGAWLSSTEKGAYKDEYDDMLDIDIPTVDVKDL